MERLIVARHGESAYSARGLLNGDPSVRCPLTAVGRGQAQRLGGLVRAVQLDLCVTSAFERTQETAELALAGRPVPRLVVPELNDHPAGAFEGRGLDEYLEWAHTAPSGRLIPGAGESRVDALRRFARGYRVLLGRPEPSILAILHSLPISYLLAGPRRRLPLLEHADPVEVDAAAVLAAVERLEAWAAAPTW